VIEVLYTAGPSNQTTSAKSESRDDIHIFLNHITFKSFALSANSAKAELIEPTTDQQDQQITRNATKIKF